MSVSSRQSARDPAGFHLLTNAYTHTQTPHSLRHPYTLYQALHTPPTMQVVGTVIVVIRITKAKLCIY